MLYDVVLCIMWIYIFMHLMYVYIIYVYKYIWYITGMWTYTWIKCFQCNHHTWSSLTSWRLAGTFFPSRLWGSYDFVGDGLVLKMTFSFSALTPLSDVKASSRGVWRTQKLKHGTCKCQTRWTPLCCAGAFSNVLGSHNWLRRKDWIMTPSDKWYGDWCSAGLRISGSLWSPCCPRGPGKEGLWTVDFLFPMIALLRYWPFHTVRVLFYLGRFKLISTPWNWDNCRKPGTWHGWYMIYIYI